MKGLLKPRNLIIVAYVVMAGGVLALSYFNTAQTTFRTGETVRCIIGSEKDGFLSNPEVQRILLTRYGLEVDFTKMGSIEQVQLPPAQLADVDCLWPSNTSASEIFALENPTVSVDDEVIFNSPIILYTWADVLTGLESEGIVEENADGIYVTDMEVMADLMVQPRPSWENLNIDIFNDFRIITSDPTRSNSGNMFYALFLNMLNDGNIAGRNELEIFFPEIQEYYDAQGLLEGSSGDLFDKYVTQGQGAYPLMANYESLIIELSVANRDRLDLIQDRVRIIYPEPTVYSAHPLIALTDNGERLLEALKDEDLQRIAWEQHGFRSALPNITNDPSVLSVAGIPAQLDSIINLPRPQAMLDMVEGLQQGQLQ
ncbi:MAG: hypothetical protein AAFV33_05410 [Chloroflexota bacterium]